MDAQAVRDIHGWLGRRGLFDTPDNDAVKAVTTRLQSLPRADAAAVLDTLKHNSDLDRVAAESVERQGAWLGSQGLSVDEERSFLSVMAGKLDGTHLAALL